jgi:hypothetical protein
MRRRDVVVATIQHECRCESRVGLIHTKGMYQALSDFQDPPLRVALWRTRRRDEIRLCQGYDGHVARQGSAFAKATTDTWRDRDPPSPRLRRDNGAA